MADSERRILTTHAGSLPRPKELSELLGRKSRHEPIDERALDDLVSRSTASVVARQLEAGIDIGNDGEQGRESFFTYVQHRMTGFSGHSQRPVMSDLVRYPTFLALKAPEFARVQVDLMHAPMATGEVRYVAREAIEKQCHDFRRALAAQERQFTAAFMTAPSPGIVAAAMLNSHYESMRDYVTALSGALRVEYQTIIADGLVLQLDCPDLAMERHTSFAGKPLRDFLDFVALVVEAINRAIEGLPRDRVRMHVCWGNYEGPHNDDVPLEAIIEHLYQAKVGALMLSMANPRHAHEYRCFAQYPLPRHLRLIVGAIDTTSNYVEHPEVVAERIERAVQAVGDPERVMAGTDCGFATSAGLGEVADEVVWLKLRALSDGAAIASKRLFS
ncbi:MAG: cobalamin-independent methionine synthase II family protein [Candidatus Binataceae bacterium]